MLNCESFKFSVIITCSFRVHPKTTSLLSLPNDSTRIGNIWGPLVKLEKWDSDNNTTTTNNITPKHKQLLDERSSCLKYIYSSGIGSNIKISDIESDIEIHNRHIHVPTRWWHIPTGKWEQHHHQQQYQAQAQAAPCRKKLLTKNIFSLSIIYRHPVSICPFSVVTATLH